MIEKDDFIWLPCESKSEFSVPIGGQVYDVKNNHYIILGDDSKEYHISQSIKLRHMHPSSIEGVEDMISLGELTECSILRNLRKRYTKQQIYTYTGSILIALNPYQQLPIYGPSFMNLYRNKRIGELSPHLFAIGDNAFFNLKRFRKNQCIIISGESGAGKTESTKLLLKYLTTNSSQNSLIEQQILDSNPILEAFGNAKSVRNDNSSRFGKYIEINFNLNEGGRIISAFLEQYLLEKSRLVHVNSGEKNYHIFYCLLHGKSSDILKKEWALDSQHQYSYLNKEIVEKSSIESQLYEKQFKEVISALKVLHFEETELSNIWIVLATVLHLGNIHFETILTEHSEGSKIINSQFCSTNDSLDINQNEIHLSSEYNHLSWAARLLEVSESELKNALTLKKLKTGGECVTVMRTCSNAINVRDSLAKALYGQLFSWLVSRINKIIQNKMSYNKIVSTNFVSNKLDDSRSQSFVEKYMGVNTIGILDIFGFENFDTNSFEQLCINYANENLQQFFVKHIFKLEQEEYNNEGLSLSAIEFIDNQATLDLIAIKPMNLLSIIDEESRFPQGTDQTMLQKMIFHHQKDLLFIKPISSSQQHFSIKHFAGNVRYIVTGFLEKSRDTYSNDLATLLAKSQSGFLQTLFEEKLKGDPRKIAPSLGLQFKRSLSSLMKTLCQCTPFFVRCVKPNEIKSCIMFDQELCARQLRYAGMMETIRIRKSGFPIRHAFLDFVKRYRVILIQANILTRRISLRCNFQLFDANRKKTAPLWVYKPIDFLHYRQLETMQPKDLKQLTNQICELILKSDDFCLGTNKVFLKDYHDTVLELERDKVLDFHATKIQSYWRKLVSRRAYISLIKGIIRVQALVRGHLARQYFRSLKQQMPHSSFEERSSNPRHSSETVLSDHYESDRVNLSRFHALKIAFPTELITNLQAYCKRWLVRNEFSTGANTHNMENLTIIKHILDSTKRLVQEKELNSNSEIWDKLHQLHRKFVADYRQLILTRNDYTSEKSLQLAFQRFDLNRTKLLKSYRKSLFCSEPVLVTTKAIPAAHLSLPEIPSLLRDCSKEKDNSISYKSVSLGLDKFQKFSIKYYHEDAIKNAFNFHHGWLEKPLTKLSSNNDQLAALILWEMLNRFMFVLPDPIMEINSNFPQKTKSGSSFGFELTLHRSNKHIKSANLTPERRTYFGPLGCINKRNSSMAISYLDSTNCSLIDYKIGESLVPQINKFFMKKINSKTLEECFSLSRQLNKKLKNSQPSKENLSFLTLQIGKKNSSTEDQNYLKDENGNIVIDRWTDLQMLQFITAFGVIRSNLCDEIYCQICKQILDNPSSTSAFRGWIVFCVCLGTFPPSEKLHKCLSQMIEQCAPNISMLLSCRSRLERCKAFYHDENTSESIFIRKCPLSSIEYQMFTQNFDGHCELKIHLVDSPNAQNKITKVETFKFDCYTTIQELFIDICDKIKLKDYFGFTIFLLFDGQISPLGSVPLMDIFYKCEQYITNCLSTSDSHKTSSYVKMQTQISTAFEEAKCFLNQKEKVILHFPWIFILRKQIFAPWHDSLEDPVASNLICNQLFQGLFNGQYVLNSEKKFAWLLALRLYVLGSSSGHMELSKNALKKQLASIISNVSANSTKSVFRTKILGKDQLDKWTDLVIEVCVSKKLFSQRPSLEMIRTEIVKIAMNEWPEKFSKYFPVISLINSADNSFTQTNQYSSQMECELFIKINHTGIEIVQNLQSSVIFASILDCFESKNQIDGCVLEKLDFIEISSVSSKKTDRSIHPADFLTIETLKNRKFVFSTVHAKEISDLLVYILNQLKIRSNFVVATRSYGRKQPKNHLQMQAGDLIEIKQPGPNNMSIHFEQQPMKYYFGVNLNIDRSKSPPGYFPRAFCQVLPCVVRPSDGIVQELFLKDISLTTKSSSSQNSPRSSCVTPPIYPTKVKPLQFNRSNAKTNGFTLENFASSHFSSSTSDSKIDKSLWSFSPTPISQPLLKELASNNTYLSQMALNSYVGIMQFMKDTSLNCQNAYRLTDVIFEAFLMYSVLTDEIYCQIIKQLTFNLDQDSIERGWQLLWLASGISAPNNRELLNEVLRILEGWNSLHPLAEICRDRIQIMTRLGTRRLPPTLVELVSVQEGRLVITHRFTLPTKSFQTHLQVDSTTKVFDIRDQLLAWIKNKYFEGISSKEFLLRIDEELNPEYYSLYGEIMDPETGKESQKFMISSDMFFMDFIRFIWNEHHKKSQSNNRSKIIHDSKPSTSKTVGIFSDISMTPPSYHILLMKNIWIAVDPGINPTLDSLFHFPQEVSSYLHGLRRCSVKDILLLGALLMLHKKLQTVLDNDKIPISEMRKMLEINADDEYNMFIKRNGNRFGEIMPPKALIANENNEKIKESLLITYYEVINTLCLPKMSHDEVANNKELVKITQEEILQDVVTETLRILSSKTTFGSRFFSAHRGDSSAQSLSSFDSFYIAVNDEAMFLVTQDALNVFEIIPHKRIKWIRLIATEAEEESFSFAEQTDTSNLNLSANYRLISMLVHPVGSLVLENQEPNQGFAKRQAHEFTFELESNFHVLELLHLLQTHRKVKDSNL